MDETDREWLDRYVIESYFLPLEAGGAAHDIDGDGDLTSFSVATAKATRAKTLFIADTPVIARDMLHGHTGDLGEVDGHGTSTSSSPKWPNGRTTMVSIVPAPLARRPARRPRW